MKIVRLTNEYFYLEPNVWYMLIADVIDMGQSPDSKDKEEGPLNLDGKMLVIEYYNHTYICHTGGKPVVYKVLQNNYFTHQQYSVRKYG